MGELTTLVREHNDNDATTASAANMERAVFIFIFSALLSFCALANGQVFDFSAEAGSQEVKEAVMGIDFADQTGSKLGVDYRITDIKITDFDVDRVYLTTESETDFLLHMSGVSMTATAVVTAEVNLFFWTTTAVADAELSLNDAVIDQSASNQGGESSFEIEPTSCETTVPNAKLTMSGRDLFGTLIATIHGYLDFLFENDLRKMIRGRICPAIQPHLRTLLDNFDMSDLKK